MFTGTVYIVGAGPGDPELLTVKARRLLDEADVILHDSLVGSGIIEQLPKNADVLNVGKRPDEKHTSQAEINRLMVSEAEQGKTVVRLKGGDPTVFARGGEEATFLAEHGIAFEIVPGISSVLAAPETAGIPLTHRSHSSSVTVITGHETPAKESSSLDWEALSRTVSAGGTLVILMGVRRLAENVSALIDLGVASETPVAVIENASLPEEVSITGTLANIAQNARDAGIDPPAVTVVGEVVGIGTAGTSGQASASASQLAHLVIGVDEHANHRS